MIEKLTQKDCKKYLKFGENTEPFLSNEYVIKKVEMDYQEKIKTNPQYLKIQSLMAWIKHCVVSGDEEFNKKSKFKRTSKEIWESGVATGCTDYALLFCTFARQLGIPTTFLQTVSKDTLEQIKNGEKIKLFKGHSFCECFLDGKWILCDPTFKSITFNYDLPTFNLHYNVGECTCFSAFDRGVDKRLYKSIFHHNQSSIKKINNMLEANTINR